MSGGIRVPTIPNNVRKMIQNLKEIYLNHTDDEIYAVLKECSMDPNETAQKLLHQDTFHEVKRKKDRKFETNREIADSRRSSPPGRGGRGGRGNHSSRYSAQVSLDAGDGRNTSAVKENGHAFDKAGSVSSLHVALEGKRDKGSSVIDVASGPIGVLSGTTNNTDTSNVLPGSLTKHPEISSKSRSHISGIKRFSLMPGVKAQSVSAAVVSGVCSSAMDPVLVPTSVTGVPAAGAIKCEVGSQRSHGEQKAYISAEQKSNAGKMGGKSQGVGKNQAIEVMQSSHGSSSLSRPSSNYGNRSQPTMGSQKGHNKEWKPKSTNTSAVQVPKAPTESDGSDVLVEISSSSEVSNILIETSSHSQPVERTIFSEEGTNKLQQELESLHVRDAQHVIIPNHIHVPDAVRTSLNFGSFDAGFVLPPKHSTESTNEDSKIICDAHQDKADTDTVEEQASSGQNTLTLAEEAEYTNCSSTPEGAETLSSDDGSVPSSVRHLPVFNGSKETTCAPQNSSVHTSYSFQHSPPMVGNQLGQTNGSESQARDVSDVPGFVGGNSMVLPTPGTPLVAPAAGVMPNSIAVTQPPLPILRQPAGIHIPHYPPNFIPYGHYFSPFYVPPPAMHQFFGTNAFHQQAQTGNLYPPPPAASLAPVKFPPSQYKPGNNPGNSSHMGVGGGYGPYGVPPSGFNSGPAAAAGNTVATEEHATSQFKDNVYFTGQQTEGPAVWFPGPGRDISNLPANAFYNLPHGQHMAYGPTQAGQGAYAGIFHPAQAVTAANVHPLLQQSQAMPGAVDMTGATASVYQQPQHPQMNWPNNY